LNQWQITEGITPFGLARAAPTEHAVGGVLVLKLGNQQRDEVALCGAVLLEVLPNSVSDQRHSRIGHIGEHVLLHRCALVSQALPKPFVDAQGIRLHEVIVAAADSRHTAGVVAKLRFPAHYVIPTVERLLSHFGNLPQQRAGGEMPLRTVMFVATLLCISCGLAHADFKYTQSGQFTNGLARIKAAVGSQAAEVTFSVQGAILRIDLPDGTYGIIDLEGRREIQVDPKNRTYSIVTFDEIRARDKETSEKFPSHVTQDLSLNVTSTGKTRTLLDKTAQETMVEISHNSMQSLVVDSWTAPSVDGFNEVSDFYARLSSAIRSGTDAARFPAVWGLAHLMMGTELSLNSLAGWPAVMSKGILDLCKVANAPDGAPLLQIYREYAVPLSPPAIQNPSASPSDARSPGAVPANSAAKIGEDSQQELATEFTLRITSFSADKLDKGLFQIPPGYKESHVELRDMWIVGIGQ
jgi:hypothetical protein